MIKWAYSMQWAAVLGVSARVHKGNLTWGGKSHMLHSKQGVIPGIMTLAWPLKPSVPPSTIGLTVSWTGLSSESYSAIPKTYRHQDINEGYYEFHCVNLQVSHHLSHKRANTTCIKLENLDFIFLCAAQHTVLLGMEILTQNSIDSHSSLALFLQNFLQSQSIVAMNVHAIVTCKFIQGKDIWTHCRPKIFTSWSLLSK